MKRSLFVVVIERGESRIPIFMTDENDDAVRFRTREEARKAAVGAMWEHTWVWWIVDLADGGMTVYGPDVDP